MVRFKFANLTTGVHTSFPAPTVLRTDDIYDKARRDICDCICEAEHFVSGEPLKSEPELLSLEQYLIWCINGNASTTFKRIVFDPNRNVEVSVRKTR